MRKGTQRYDWNRYEQAQNKLLRACFNEQAAEAAARKVALATSAVPAQ
jgi:hypothetical protein